MGNIWGKRALRFQKCEKIAGKPNISGKKVFRLDVVIDYKDPSPLSTITRKRGVIHATMVTRVDGKWATTCRKLVRRGC